MGKVFITPVTDDQRREKAANAQNESTFNEIRQSISTEAANRISADNTLTQNLSALSDTVTAEINERKATLSSETALREAAIDGLTAALDYEFTARNTAETRIRSEINSAVDTEKTARMTADRELLASFTVSLNDEANLREEADTDILSTLTSETNLRATADNILDVALSSEAHSRAEADSALSTALETEKQARIDADNALKRSITAIIDEETGSQISSLDDKLDAAVLTLQKKDTDLGGAITEEKSTRELADNTLRSNLQTAINSEKAAREFADNAIRSGLTLALASYAPLNSPTFTGVVKVPAITAGSEDTAAANKSYVDGKLSNIELGLNVFTAPTASKAGTAGLVPAPGKGLQLQLLTNFGWRTPDDSTITISTLPMQSGSLTYNRDEQAPSWANFDPNKMELGGTLKATNAGVYIATVKPISTYIWADTLDQRTKEIPWAILPLMLAKPTGSNLAFEYDKAAHAPTIHNFNATYIDKTGTDSATNKGAYQLTFTLKSTTNTRWSDDTVDEVVIDWAVNVRKIAKPAAVSDDFDYTGSACTLSISGFDGEYMTQGGTLSATAVGEYKASFSLKDTKNTQWADGSVSAFDIPWTITKKVLSEEQSSGFAQTGTLTYTGSAQTPAIANYNAKFHVLESETSKVNAGSYTLTIKPAGSYTWADGTTTAKPVPWTINPQPVDKPTASSSKINYSGATVDFVPTYAPNATAAYSIATDSVKSASALGSYAVKYVLTSKTNYVWKGGGTDDVTLNWQIVTNVLSADLSSGFAQAAALTFNNATQTVTISHTSSTYHTVTGNSASDAGTYTATIIPVYGYTWNGTTPAPSACTDGKEVGWTIGAVKSAKPTLSQNEWDYTGATVNAQNKLGGGYNTDIVEFSGDLSASEPGSYTITAKLKNPAGKSNYQWADGSTADFSLGWRIGARLIDTPKVTGSGTPYLDGDHLVINGGEFDYSGSAKSIVVSGFASTYMNSEGTLSATDAGTYEVVYTLKDTEVTLWNVTLPTDDPQVETLGSGLPVVIRWKINPIKLSAEQSTFSVSGEYYYNGSEQTVTISGYNANLHTISGNTGRLCGRYTARITPKQNYAFSDGTSEKTVNWNIQRAQVRLNMSNLSWENNCWVWRPTFTYNENTTVNVSASLNYTVTKGNITPTLDGGTQSAQNAGTYTTKLEAIAPFLMYGMADFFVNGQTGTSSSVVIEWTINRKPLSYYQSSPGSATYTYGDAPANPIPNYDVNLHVGGITALPANAGTYNYTIYPSGNYCWNDGSTTGKQVTITINPKPIAKPKAIQSEFTYNSTVTVPFLNSYVEGYDSTTMAAGSTTAAKNAGDYTLTIALKNTTNYKWSDNTTEQFQINWKIKPCPVAIPTASKTSFVYIREPISILDYIKGYDSSLMFVPSQISDVGTDNNGWRVNSSSAASGGLKVAFVLNDRNNYTWSGTVPEYRASWGYYYNGSYRYVDANVVVIEWEITPLKVSKPYCKYNDTTIEWTGSEINWLEYAIAGYDSATMKVSTTYNQKAIRDYSFTISPLNSNIVWADGTSDALTFNWSIVRQRLSGDENGDWGFCVTNATYGDNESFYYHTTGNGATPRPTAEIRGYNPDKHLLYRVAEGGSAASTLNLTWTVGEYTWGIEPKDNYAWADGTYGRKTFKVRVIKSPLSVVFDSGYDTVANGSGAEFASSCKLKITDDNVMSGATYGIGRSVTFHLVDYAGNTVQLSSSDLTVTSSTANFAATRSGNTIKLYGLANGNNFAYISFNETTNYLGTDINISYIDVTTDRSLSSVQSWAKIREICQAGLAPDYAKGGETYPVTLKGTVGTVDVSGDYIAQLINVTPGGDKVTVWAICKKSGVDGHIAFADSYYGTLVTNGAKAFAHITNTDETVTYDKSALRARGNEFYNAFSSPAKSYLVDDIYFNGIDKIYFDVSESPYFKNGNKAPFKHFKTGAAIKVWESMWANGTTRAATFNGNSATYETPDLHMSLGLVPVFTIG